MCGRAPSLRFSLLLGAGAMLLSGCLPLFKRSVVSASPPLAAPTRFPASTLPAPPPGLQAIVADVRIDPKSLSNGMLDQTMMVEFLNNTPETFEAIEVELITKGRSPAYRERVLLEGGFKDSLEVHTGRLLPMQITTAREIPGKIPQGQWTYGRETRVRIVGARPTPRTLDPKDADSVWSLIRREKAPAVVAALKAYPAIARIRTSEGVTPMLMACAQIDPAQLETIRTAGGSFGERTKDGFGALHFAAMSGSKAIVQRLVREGLSPNAPARDGMTPLHVAVRSRNVETAKALVAAGADLEARDRFGRTPLMIAPEMGVPQMAEALIALGANLKAAGPEGDTFLASAAAYGRTDFIEIGLAHGLKIDACDPARGITPLHMAAKYGRTETVAWLLDHGADPDRRSSNGNRPIDLFYKYNANPVDGRMMERAFAAHMAP